MDLEERPLLALFLEAAEVVPLEAVMPIFGIGSTSKLSVIAVRPNSVVQAADSTFASSYSLLDRKGLLYTHCTLHVCRASYCNVRFGGDICVFVLGTLILSGTVRDSYILVARSCVYVELEKNRL